MEPGQQGDNKMNEDQTQLAQDPDCDAEGSLALQSRARGRAQPDIPTYLQETYWWAYLHENSFWFFEREWVVNLILWGNMRRLTNQVLEETRLAPRSRALQVACVYGNFSSRLADRLAQSGSRLDLVDVAPIQLHNARRKLSRHRNVAYQHQDSADLHYPDATFDHSVLFFLLHEQPEAVRRKTISEAIRVTRPGGKVVFVDYHRPRRSHPLRYLMKPVLHWLEPFAMDLWRSELTEFLPPETRPEQVRSEFYFGGLYQKVVLTR
jgi:ubiquinone/menaquinone biosynthesis C-methylase UbiE